MQPPPGHPLPPVHHPASPTTALHPPPRTFLAVLAAILACGHGVLPLAPFPTRAADYHVDADQGDDARSGLSPDSPWRTLARAQAATLDPGDRILLRAGRTWPGPLVIRSSGTPGHPIRWDRYGRGPAPHIVAPTGVEDVVRLENVQHLELHGLEISHAGSPAEPRPRRGVHILADNCGTLPGIVVADLFIHDIRGTQQQKDNGGIIFRTLGRRIPSRFDGLRLERNIVWRVDRSGIAAQSEHARRDRWFPSPNVVIRDNWVGDVGGDGIVPWATDGALLEHNIVEGANERAASYNAGIWPWSADHTVIRLNRASGVKTLLDGQGFDADYNCRGTVLEYNLSHDNEGGFLLICSPGDRRPTENLGNRDTLARFNISRNDGARIFHLSAVEDTILEHNAIYVRAEADVQMFLLSDWSGWARGVEVRHNLFFAEGIARYGHGAVRHSEGSYTLAEGWGPARDIHFSENRLVGHHLDLPFPPTSASPHAPRPIRFPEWPGPRFDPKSPQSFPAYLAAHRAWMLHLMQRQFGQQPRLSAP